MALSEETNNLKVEILISTMNKTSLSFVKKMFPSYNLEDLFILIINQTEKDKELISNFNNIRVINVFEKGLTKSRNLAIKNAVGDICVIADDDVVYVDGFLKIIKKAFLNHRKKISVAIFKIETFTGENYKVYPGASKILNTHKYIKSVSSIEIAFLRKDIIENGILFNTHFGLGSTFTSGEEYLFLKEVINNDLIISYENKVIVKHSLERSTSDVGNDKYIYAKAALYYNDYKDFGYLFLIKLIFFLLRHKRISLKEVIRKFNVGRHAIINYKKMIK